MTGVFKNLASRLGLAVLKQSTFDELTGALHRVGREADQLRRSECALLDQIAELRSELEAQALELKGLRVTQALNHALAGTAEVPPDAFSDEKRKLADQRFVERLNQQGLSITPNEKVYLHVGFGHSATTSLQLNFFSRRPDIFYPGTPYGQAGGFFSDVKYLDDSLLNETKLLELCRDQVYAHPRREGRPIVISDETLCDASEVYFLPRHVPADLIASRLKRYFPTAKIIFTIRHQVDYIASMYFNLKRNYAFLAGMPIPEFDDWWSGMHTQVRCTYLQNLDYSQLIGAYSRLFGRENVLVLPLEELKTHGARRYLENLCQFLELEARESDVAEFSNRRNERMTVVENRLAEVITSGSTELTSAVRALLEKDELNSIVSHAPRLTLKLNENQLREVRRVVAAGNRRMAEEFALPLEELGYFV